MKWRSPKCTFCLWNFSVAHWADFVALQWWPVSTITRILHILVLFQLWLQTSGLSDSTIAITGFLKISNIFHEWCLSLYISCIKWEQPLDTWLKIGLVLSGLEIYLLLNRLWKEIALDFCFPCSLAWRRIQGLMLKNRCWSWQCCHHLKCLLWIFLQFHWCLVLSIFLKAWDD